MTQGPKALRLTFSYRNGVVELVSSHEVDMTVPPGDAPAITDEHGFWAELRDASKKSLFRRVLRNPIPVDREVFSNEPGKTIARVPGGPSEGMFSIVVPNDPDAASLALFSSHHETTTQPPPSGGSPHALPVHVLNAVPGGLHAAREIAQFDLKKT